VLVFNGEVLDHALQCLSADIGGEYNLIFEAVEAPAAEYLFGEGVGLLGSGDYVLLQRLAVLLHLLSAIIDNQFGS
jgi:hypothetical protein